MIVRLLSLAAGCAKRWPALKTLGLGSKTYNVRSQDIYKPWKNRRGADWSTTVGVGLCPWLVALGRIAGCSARRLMEPRGRFFGRVHRLGRDQAQSGECLQREQRRLSAFASARSRRGQSRARARKSNLLLYSVAIGDLQSCAQRMSRDGSARRCTEAAWPDPRAPPKISVSAR